MTIRAARVRGPLFALAALLLVSSEAWGLACEDLPLMQLRLQDGTLVRIFASDDQIDETERWRVEKNSAPPLSLPKALKIARRWADKTFSEFDELRIGRISLNERRCGFSRDHWFYVFDFDPVKDGKVQLGTGHFVAVLMDGTVLPPNEPPGDD